MSKKGVLRVLLVRMDVLADAIRERDWQRVEWEYGRVRSKADQLAGVRSRETDVQAVDGVSATCLDCDYTVPFSHEGMRMLSAHVRKEHST